MSDDIVGNISSLGIDHIGNRFVLAGTTGGRSPGAVLDGAWVHPDFLAQLATQGVGGLLVAGAGHEERGAEPNQEYETMHDSLQRHHTQSAL